MQPMRMMVVFEKGPTLRHIGHLDLMRTIQRALRRSKLPVAYSQGFNPHMELSFASPLGVGVVGLREIMDIPLAGEITEEEFTERLSAAFPSVMKVVRSRLLADDFPTLMALTAASRYTLKLEGEAAAAKAVIEQLPAFLALEEYEALRKTKSGEKLCNIRPFVKEAQGAWTEDSGEIRCVLEATPQGTLKPSLFIKALRDMAKVEALPYIAIREEILCRQKDGELVRMEDFRNAW